jgi:hypothetical protein
VKKKFPLPGEFSIRSGKGRGGGFRSSGVLPNRP